MFDNYSMQELRRLLHSGRVYLSRAWGRNVKRCYRRQQSTLVIVEVQSFATELLQQSIDLSILELDDLLLTLVEEAADGHKQNVPGPEQEGHGYRRKSASFRCRQVKSRGGKGKNTAYLKSCETRHFEFG